MPNQPLTARAGNNVGVQSSSPFIQSVGSHVLRDPTETTVILQGADGHMRSPTQPIGVSNVFQALNYSADDFEAKLFFVDAEGRETQVGPDLVVAGGTTIPQAVSFLPEDVAGLLICLAGERFELRPVANGEGVVLLISFCDYKFKGSDGGGFSDGGIVTVRGAITPSGLEIGPPAGKAWMAAPAASTSLSLAPLLVANFVDATAEVFEGVLNDGELVETTDSVSVSALSLGNVALLMRDGLVLSYPDKLVLRTDPDKDSTTVYALFAFLEFDLPSDFPQP